MRIFKRQFDGKVPDNGATVHFAHTVRPTNIAVNDQGGQTAE